MKHQRGIISDLIIYAIAAVAVIGVLYGVYEEIHNDGYEQGKNEVLNEWAAKDREAEEAEAIAAENRRKAAAAVSTDLATANARADNYQARLRQAAARNASVLASVECKAAGNVAVVGNSNPGASGGIVLRLSTDFLREYNAQWTDAKGEPVFSDTSGITDPSAAPVGLDTLLTIHAENAARCSATSRRYSKLIDLILTLQGIGKSVDTSP